MLLGAAKWGRAWTAGEALSRDEKRAMDPARRFGRTALNKHGRLVRYAVCLPMDLAAPRARRKSGVPVKSLRDGWNEHVSKWRHWATEFGMAVEFVYWVQFEIAERLSMEVVLTYWIPAFLHE